MSPISSIVRVSEPLGLYTSRSTNPAPSSPKDQVDLSQVPQLSQKIQQLGTSKPSEATQVLLDAAANLRAEARHATDPAQAIFLSGLADKFQAAALTTGEIDPVTGQQPPPPQ